MPKGKSFDKRKVKLDEYFRNGMHPLTLDEITEKLIVELELESLDKRTVQEDIKHLKMIYNAPIVSPKIGKKTVWRYEDSTFSIQKIPIDPKELEYLQQTVDIISAMKTFSVSRRLQDIVLKLKQENKRDNNLTGNFIQFETNENTEGYQYFDPIYEAIKERTVLQITYQRFISDKEKVFFIHPYLLKEYRNRWYVVCLIDGENDITTFGLDRISKIQNSLKPYQQNKYIVLDKYFYHVIGIYRTKKDFPVKIKIKVAKEQVPYFEKQPLHHTQQIKVNKNGSALMQYNLIINLELKQLLLSYAGSIKVIEPAGLKKEIKVMLEGGL